MMNTLSRLSVCLLIFVLWTAGTARAQAEDVLAVPCVEPCDPPAPLVTVKVRVPACVPADGTLEYRILVENRSPAAAHRVVVLDKLPANARFVRASPQPHQTEPELQWRLGTLKANGCQEITLILAPTNAEDVANCVRVQFEHGVCVCTRQVGSSPPPTPRTPGEATRPPTTEEPPLAIAARLDVKVKGPKQHAIGEPARYTITVANVGTAPARDVSIESVLPEKMTHVPQGKTGIFFQDRVVWSVGDLPANASHTVELVVRTAESGLFCIRTRAGYHIPERSTARYTQFTDSCTSFLGPTGLLLEMYDREDPIPVGGKTSYLIWVRNQGDSPATNIRIEAVVPPGMDLTDVRPSVGYKVEGKTVVFEPIATLAGGATMEYEVFTRALVAGDLRFKIQMSADQLDKGPVHEEESTTVYSEDTPPRGARLQPPPTSPFAPWIGPSSLHKRQAKTASLGDR